MMAEPPSTKLVFRSCEVRVATSATPGACSFLMSAAPARNAPSMVGLVLIRLMSPAATAPAPM
jgi:hypothetical protein